MVAGYIQATLNAGRLSPMDQVVVVVVLSRQRNTARSLLLLRLVFPLVLARRSGFCCWMLAANVKGIPITCRVITFFWMRRLWLPHLFIYSLSLVDQMNPITNYYFFLLIVFFFLNLVQFCWIEFGFCANIVYNLKRGIINSGFVVQRHLGFQIETTRRKQGNRFFYPLT